MTRLLIADGFGSGSANTDLMNTDGAAAGGPGSRDPAPWILTSVPAPNASSWQYDGLGHAYTPSSGSQETREDAVVETHASDVEVQLTITSVTAAGENHAGICLRYVDASNYLLVVAFTPDGSPTALFLAEFVAGAFTNILYPSGIALGSGDVLKVRADGDQVTTYKNGSQVDDRTWATFLTATKHGLTAHTRLSTPPKIDNFYVTDLHPRIGRLSGS